VPQEPPADNGCGPSLAWWFRGDADTKRAPAKKKDPDAPEPVFALPDACGALTVD